MQALSMAKRTKKSVSLAHFEKVNPSHLLVLFIISILLLGAFVLSFEPLHYSRALVVAVPEDDSGDNPQTPVVDQEAPIRSGATPSTTQPAGTTQLTIALATNENSTCRYSANAGTVYSSMSNSMTAINSGQSHSALVSGLLNGQTYNYYVRCQDQLSNVNADDYPISFSIASSEVTPPPSTNPETTPPPSTNPETTPPPSTNPETTPPPSTNPETTPPPSNRETSSESDNNAPNSGESNANQGNEQNINSTKNLSDNVSSDVLARVLAVTNEERELTVNLDPNLTRRLAGRILLQIERLGQAWYLDPISLARYYLADGPTAYEALRKFGLGIKTADLNKIPVGHESRFEMTDTDKDGLPDKLEEGLGTKSNQADSDADGVSDADEVLKNDTNPLSSGALTYSNSLINRLKGRIVLQIESRGEAWYIYPVDGKRYYLANGEAAYQIMRYLSLGITNIDIRKIKVGTWN